VTASATIDLVDTHCHLNLDEFDADRGEVLARATDNGIGRILIPGIDIETSKTAIKCSIDYKPVYAAVGVHPNNGSSRMRDSLVELKQLVSQEKVVAIGEIGLDYYRDYTPKDVQRSLFSKQLEFAAEIGLPVIVHNRDASEDIIDLLMNWQKNLMSDGCRLADHPGVLHSFSGSVEMAQEMAEHHFKIGITGAVTFRNAYNLQAVVEALSLESILIETDAPYQTPHPYRGKRNEPSNVRIVAEKIAEIKAIPLEEIAKVASHEADKLFNWREIHC
jgi:TatD DNase family protein